MTALNDHNEDVMASLLSAKCADLDLKKDGNNTTLFRRVKVHSYLAKRRVTELKEICGKLGFAIDGTKAALIKRIEEHLEASTNASGPDLMLWTIPSPGNLPILPPELVRKIAQMSGPIVSRLMRNMNKGHRVLITADDLLWAEAGWRQVTKGLEKVFWWAVDRWIPDVICAYATEMETAFPSQWPQQEALERAMEKGDLETTKRLMDLGAATEVDSTEAIFLATGNPTALQSSNANFTGTHPALMKNFWRVKGTDFPSEAAAMTASIRLAAKQGDTEIVRIFLKNHGNKRQLAGIALESAAEHGHVDVIQLALENIGDTTDALGVSWMKRAIRLAALNGHVEIVHTLLQQASCLAEEALTSAAEGGHIEVVKTALKAGADVHYRDDQAIRMAAGNGDAEVFRLLLASGANAQAGSVSAFTLGCGGGFIEIVNSVLDAGVDLGLHGGFALGFASSCGQVDVVKLLLAAGVDVHARRDFALRHAVKDGQVEVVKALLEAGGDVGADDHWAIKFVVGEENIEMLTALLDAAHGEGTVKKALVAAATSGKVAIVELVLGRGTSESVRQLALYAAASAGHTEVVNVLLKTTLSLKAHILALKKASTGGHVDVVRILLSTSLSLDPTMSSTVYRSGLDVAIRETKAAGQKEIVKVLLDAGGDR
ncbi:hypothetical protein HDV00_012276 [Rhizophlyctis rosea]|nr:hypothetical protein HDV00_012276 [Rhizophlyctis rosea]